MLLTNIILLFMFVFIIIYELLRKRTFFFDALFFFHIWFVISYIISPLLINNFGKEFAHRSFYDLTILGNEIPILIVLIFYLFFTLGYNARISKKQLSSYQLVGLKEKKQTLFIVSLFLIGMAGILIFINEYGGIGNIVENGNRIRNGNTDRNTMGAIFGLFSVYIYYSIWILLAYILIRKQSNKKVNKWLYFIFISMLIIAVSWGLLRGSRGGLLQIFLMMYLITVFINKKFYLKYIILFVPLAVFVLLYGKVFFYSLSLDYDTTFDVLKREFSENSISDSFKSLMHNFAHPYMSLHMSIDLVGDKLPMRWFMDIPYSFVFYLQIFGVEVPSTITYINTYYAIGRYESNIPPGLIAFLWYSLKLPGIIFGAFIFGGLLQKVNKIFLILTECKTPIAITIYIYIITKIGQSIFIGDLRVLMIQNFAFIIMLLFYLAFYTKITVKRN